MCLLEGISMTTPLTPVSTARCTSSFMQRAKEKICGPRLRLATVRPTYNYTSGNCPEVMSGAGARATFLDRDEEKRLDPYLFSGTVLPVGQSLFLVGLSSDLGGHDRGRALFL